MNENVSLAVGFDEAVPLFVVEPLNPTLRHANLLMRVTF
jgi:hypothetical protein